MKNLWILILLLSTSAFAQKPELIKDINPSGDSEVFFFAQIGNTVYFRATDGTNGRELWVTDGTEAGTYMVKDINPSGNASITRSAVLGNKLIFNAYDGATYGLWISDGTAAGTQLIKEINPGGSSYPNGFTTYQGKVYFRAQDGVNGYELWVTDGTTAGTQLLKDINTSSGSSSDPEEFLVTDIGLFFYAEPASGQQQLWVTDGTSGGTVYLMSFGNTNSGGYLELVGMIGNDVILDAYSFVHGRFLLRVDAIDLSIDVLDNEVAGDPIIADGKIYFGNENATYGSEPWISDGTIGGTQLLKDIYVGSTSSYAGYFAAYNGNVYFAANEADHGTELWVTDGTTAGTQLFKDLVTPGSSAPARFFIYDGMLMFGAYDNTANYKLWRTDGTSSGTSKLMDLNSGGDDIDFNFMRLIIGDKLYMKAKDGVNNDQLWVSEAGAYPSMLIPDIAPLSDPLSSTGQLWDNGSGVYFKAEYSTIGRELYKLVDTSNTTSVIENPLQELVSIYPNPTSNSTTIQLALKERTAVEYSLYSITGMQVTKPVSQSLDAGQHMLPVDMSSLPQGMYLVEISVGSETATIRVMKVD